MKTRLAIIIFSVALLGLAVAGGGHWYAGQLTIQATHKCIDQLRTLDGAKQEWALEFHKDETDTPTWDQIKPFMSCALPADGLIPKCPSGGTYTIGSVSNAPACSHPGHVLE